MILKRIHSTASSEFFSNFVLRYPDKQYQTWLGSDHVRVGVDYDYDNHLVENITAGIIGHYADMSLPTALNYAKRGQGLDASSIPRFEQLFDKIERRFHSTSLRFLTESRQHCTLAEEHQGIMHAELFLQRALSSLTAARRLINWGYLSEPLTILRSILEELAWAYAVGVVFDQKQLSKPNPSKCIGAFKARFSAAGLLYGVLSRFSHMEFEAKKHFVAIDPPNTGVMERSIEFKFFGLLFFSFLLVAYQYACRDLQRFYAEQHGLQIPLDNIVLPVRHLVGHALMQTQLDRDEIAAELSLIYSNVFPPKSAP